MRKCKITVVKTALFPDVIRDHSDYGPDHTPCPCFKEGDVFVSDGLNMPEGFCGWAWADIDKFVHVILADGVYSMATPEGVKENKVIACCSDGFRPVVFLLEGVAE